MAVKIDQLGVIIGTEGEVRIAPYRPPDSAILV
jgi:hypothetical protein